jgi:hypothetical protein
MAAAALIVAATVVSGLSWHEDLEAARAEAARRGRPILSLRLLGRLDEAMSCANSRFFRSVLYRDAEVAALLRDGFVLHWSSERPAPRVTIDFGDGRRLERTLTGNSVHYVLDAEGRPVDAVPGLYAPRAFARVLRRGAEVARDCGGRAGAGWSACAARHHAAALAAVRGEAGAVPLPPEDPAEPRALAADRRAMAKSLAERPLLRALLGERPERDARPSPAPAPVLDGRLRRLLRADGLGAAALARFEAALARDTGYNEGVLHARVHDWYARGAVRGLEALNHRVYAELFLTPRADPWLGLADPDVYTALPLSPPTGAGAAPVARSSP